MNQNRECECNWPDCPECEPGDSLIEPDLPAGRFREVVVGLLVAAGFLAALYLGGKGLQNIFG